MPKKGSSIWPILALFIGILLVVSMLLQFLTYTLVLFGSTTTSGATGLDMIGSSFGYGGTSVSSTIIPVLVLIGGITGVIGGIIALAPPTRKSAMHPGIPVLVGGLIALVGATMFYSKASEEFLLINLGGGNSVSFGAGIGLWMALILAVVEIIVAIPIILKK